MYCPQCGNQVSEDDAFCPACGCVLDRGRYSETVSAAPEPAPYTPVKKSGRRPGIVLFAVSAVIIIAAAAILVPMSEEGSLAGKSFRESYEAAEDRIDGNAYSIVPVSGFSDNGTPIADICFADGKGDSGTSVLSLADSTLSGGWTVSGYDLGYDSKQDSFSGTSSLTLEGYYGDCTVSFRSDDGTVRYDFELRTDHYRSYSWKYDGGRFSFDVCIGHSETYNSKDGYSYLKPSADIVSKQRMETGLLRGNVWGNSPDFAVVTDTVQYFADTLKKLFVSAYGSVAANQDYADFILAFVQICFGYGEDESLYGYEEYFAFPLQTVFLGKGDCEDTSLLAAAVYDAAGFSSAICILPGHAVVGVALGSYSAPHISGGEILKQTVNGKTYYAGETTVNSFQELGAIAKHPRDGGGEDYYSAYLGQLIPMYGYYGFYPVDND